MFPTNVTLVNIG